MRSSRIWRGCLIGAVVIVCALVVSANFRVKSQWGERLSSNDVIIDQKSPSPDGSKLLVRYKFDSGH